MGENDEFVVEMWEITAEEGSDAGFCLPYLGSFNHTYDNKNNRSYYYICVYVCTVL